MSENNRKVYLDPYEDVTREDVLGAIGMGFVTLTEIKNYTRAGMGVDQGRLSLRLVAGELADYYHVPIGDVMKPSYRPPIEPVSIGVLADAHAESLKEGEYDR